MFRPRIIPVLLLKNSALVKSVQFKRHKYIGDPINAVRIFNELRADELFFLDIEATKDGRLISLDFVRDVGEETQMPFAVGGGIKSIDDIKAVMNAGAEKVVLGTCAGLDPDFVRRAAETFGSSTITVCIDVRRRFVRGQHTYVLNGTRATNFTPSGFASLMEANGAGELIIQNIDRDGTMAGYDIELVKSVSTSVNVPVIALGGAGSFEDFRAVHEQGFASAAAAGSLFVYQGRGVLINYPGKKIY
jgi:imidazole glycerol-phosphate synthase subunit HisF